MFHFPMLTNRAIVKIKRNCLREEGCKTPHLPLLLAASFLPPLPFNTEKSFIYLPFSPNWELAPARYPCLWHTAAAITTSHNIVSTWIFYHKQFQVPVLYYWSQLLLWLIWTWDSVRSLVFTDASTVPHPFDRQMFANVYRCSILHDGRWQEIGLTHADACWGKNIIL